MNSPNPYAPPKSAVADVVSAEVSPALWNPNAAASWSLLFSPVFGAFLHMRNWEALGEAEKAAQSKGWMIGSIAFILLVSVGPILLPQVAILETLGNASGIALLVAWYYAIGKSQNTFVVERFGKTYPRRGWTKPLLAAFGAIAAFFALIFFAAFIVGVVSGEV
jgi:hypothetical protein